MFNKKSIQFKYLFFGLVLFLLCISPQVSANYVADTDMDGVPDKDEIALYKTSIYNSDTDGDGYSDWVELVNGYSPLNAEAVTLEENDYDGDGLSDRMELNFGTDLSKADTDEDGYTDGAEIESYYNPLESSSDKLDKRIEVDTGKQELSYFLGGVRMGKFIISSGIGNTTPKGHFQIYNKHPKAWSPYGLWMPYWMAITANGRIGLHELPVWPSGYREGEDHLGSPASHGCIRLGLDGAKFMYEWSDIGTPVFIY